MLKILLLKQSNLMNSNRDLDSPYLMFAKYNALGGTGTTLILACIFYLSRKADKVIWCSYGCE